MCRGGRREGGTEAASRLIQNALEKKRKYHMKQIRSPADTDRLAGIPEARKGVVITYWLI